MDKTLNYFLRKKEAKIVTVPAPESFVDENGNRLEMKIRKLDFSEIQKIQNAYRKDEVPISDSGQPYANFSNEILVKVNRDSDKALNHLIAEAIQSPDLKSKEARDYYDCHDIAEMPLNVFSEADEYTYVVNMVTEVLGLKKDKTISEKDVEEAKN